MTIILTNVGAHFTHLRRELKRHKRLYSKLQINQSSDVKISLNAVHYNPVLLLCKVPGTSRLLNDTHLFRAKMKLRRNGICQASTQKDSARKKKEPESYLKSHLGITDNENNQVLIMTELEENDVNQVYFIQQIFVKYTMEALIWKVAILASSWVVTISKLNKTSNREKESITIKQTLSEIIY